MEKRRSYTQRKRAEAVRETRRRIVEATLALHEEVGPRATTISAIAQRAGVQRLTVYRHFPDETAVFQACTERWLELHPLPDPAAWRRIEDPAERAREALSRLYSYYRETGAMWEAAYRDEPDVPALQQPMRAVRAYLDDAAQDLARRLAGRRRAGAELRAAARHLVSFQAWQSLASEGLTDARITEAAAAWLRCLADLRPAGASARR